MVLHYKCRNCGKDMALEGDRGKEVKMCPQCGSGEVTKVRSEGKSVTEALAVYKCGDCGLIYSLDTQPTFCSYCGGNKVNRWTTESLCKKISKKLV